MVHHNLNGKYKVLLVFNGDILLDPYLLRVREFEHTREEIIVTVTRKSFRGKIAVDVRVYEYVNPVRVYYFQHERRNLWKF